MQYTMHVVGDLRFVDDPLVYKEMHAGKVWVMHYCDMQGCPGSTGIIAHDGWLLHHRNMHGVYDIVTHLLLNPLEDSRCGNACAGIRRKSSHLVESPNPTMEEERAYAKRGVSVNVPPST